MADTIVEWSRKGQPDRGDMHMLYAHKLCFEPNMDPHELGQNIAQVAETSAAPYFVIDIEDEGYVEEHREVLGQYIADIRKEGRIVAWYFYGAVEHVSEWVDQLYVPAHNYIHWRDTVKEGLNRALEHQKRLILQWSHRDLKTGKYLTLQQMATQLESMRQMRDQLRGMQLDLTVSFWASDHNGAAQDPEHSEYRPAPRMREWAYNDIAYQIDLLLDSRREITRQTFAKNVTEGKVVGFPASNWEQREQHGNRGHDGVRGLTQIWIDTYELIQAGCGDIPINQASWDLARGYLLRGFPVQVWGFGAFDEWARGL